MEDTDCIEDVTLRPPGAMSESEARLPRRLVLAAGGGSVRRLLSYFSLFSREFLESMYCFPQLSKGRKPPPMRTAGM